jgi:hypothetical protein
MEPPDRKEQGMRLRTILSLAALAAFMLAAAAPAASAKPRDRNKDGISDRWEKRHHLSLRVNQAKRDQDRDGLRNRAEYRAHTDPRDDDSDGDGVEDGEEQAGTVSAYDSASGSLTITLFGGGEITARVTPETEVECDSGDYTAKARASDEDSHADEDEHGDEDGDEDSHADEDHESDDEACAADALKVGAIVQEAEIEVSGSGAVFEEIELVQ